ncbi:hypothetical protein PoB_002539800 [Plakobranchus ocellatus]|uniref:Uncharacterized protein n=1 Tax=Plakobranchus ocellatus TaxID=259542 RepID=A0AAV3ZWT0_9GAST|nr:hypothetical protein PoB_002539800 [Plakobranchus ocellatus]
MKKSYAQTLITAYTKAAERSLLVHEPARSAEVGAGTACEANANGEEQTQQQHLPDPLVPYNPLEPLSLEQQIDIECEGYTPSPPIPNKRYSVIQARIQRLRSEDNWLKTSSLPNIRRSISIKRAGRMGSKIAENPRTLSYDYTMDEARLRRKSMMLRSIVQWNSGSSGDLVAQQAQAARALHQRRFSSAKALQTQPDDSLDELFQEQSHGSFPLTRLIQRRGTFACGDMRTRRMKFLILLQASESNEVFQQQQQQQQQHHRRQSTYPHSKHHHDNVSVDSRSASRFSGIRRNSFIPYNTCDKFITTEERRSARNSRRPSINPFAPRLAQQYAQPERSAIRRHSFFPIRREDKIFESDPLEQRRHSFNPIGVNNTLKSEYAGGAASGVYDRRGSFNPDSRRGSFNPDSRRGSFNPDSRRGSFNPDSRRGSFNPDSRRGSFAPPPSSAGQQKSPRFLQVPGFEHEFHMERRPSGDSSGSETGASSHLLSPPMHQVDPSPYTYLPRPTGKHYHFGVTSPVLESQAERQAVERRHSFNPVVRVSAAGPDSDGAAASRGPPNVPLIVVNADTSGRFLTVPSEDSEQRMVGGGMGPDSLEVRRHSFNTAPQSAYLASHNANPTLERPVPQRNISFRLDPSGLEGSPISYPTSQASSTSVTPSKQFAKRSSLKYKPQGYSPSDAAAATAVRPSSFNQEMVLFQPLALVESRGASPSSNLSYCGSERVGSERSPKASRTTSISSDYSAVTTSVYADDTLRQPLRPGESDNGFRPVSPAGHPPVYHYLPGDPRSRNFGVYDDDMTESNQYTDLSYSTHSAYQPSGGIRRCASFRESRTQPLQHIRTDSTGSADSGPATLSPSLSTNANVPIHRSRSAGSLPGERGIPRRDGDIRNLRALPRRWDDTRYTQQEARRLAEERYSTRPSPPQSPLFRPYSYASWRVPKPPSPLVGKHWPPSKHDTDSNSS